MKRFFRSLRFAVAGIIYTCKTQPNMRIHIAAAVAVLALARLLGIPGDEMALVVFAVGLVLALETANTAIEALVDLVTEERRPLAKAAKDASAGAVLIAVVTSVVIGLYVLGPPLVTALANSFAKN